ncbi:GLPGLI family protein [Tenacibaculum sp. C7A-26P2]|uniref:GLPGLI family protein n=1 Tax=Tenacibaculum sp. C7A-26P2 TaxID=3447504 RepID=UPI003F8587D7
MKTTLWYTFLFVSTIIWSQHSFQGRASYQSKTSMDLGEWGKKMSEERKKRVKERMASFLEKSYTLHFTEKESVYAEDQKLEIPGSGRGFRFGAFIGGGRKYKNFTSGVFLESIEFYGKNFLVENSADKPKWQLENETKQIGKYTCFKATLVKQDDRMDWSRIRGRNQRKGKEEPSSSSIPAKNNKEQKDEVVVTAWYTPRIPVSNGPGEYWGLPGLILEINEGNTTILCSEIVMNPEKRAEIKAPTRGDEVSREEYNRIVKKKMKEMQEMFQRRRRNNRGGGR